MISSIDLLLYVSSSKTSFSLVYSFDKFISIIFKGIFSFSINNSFNSLMVVFPYIISLIAFCPFVSGILL